MMIDLHIHILPGLDDGPSDMTEAIDMSRLAVEDGVDTVVATPHMFDGKFEVSRNSILEGVEVLRESLDKGNIPLTVVPGADVHIERNLCRLLRNGRVVTVGDHDKYIILEMPSDVLPHGLPQFLFSVQLLGITPILSHPERNFEVQDNPEVMTQFVQAGNLVQLTAASIVGDFGKRPKKCAHELLKKRLAHVVASDAHSLNKRPPGLSRARAVVEALLSREEAEKMFIRRPGMILAGEAVKLPDVAAPPKSRRRGWLPWKS